MSDTDTDGDELSHCYCDCDVDVALCGTNISGQEFVEHPLDEGLLPCVVCVDLEFQPCPRCGAEP